MTYLRTTRQTVSTISELFEFKSSELALLTKQLDTGIIYNFGMSVWDDDLERYTVQLGCTLGLSHYPDNSLELEELHLDLDNLEMSLEEPAESAFWYYLVDDNGTHFHCFYRYL